MANILHFTETEGTREYIVITEEDPTPEFIEELTRTGYVLYGNHEIDPVNGLGVIPLDRELEPV